jgi:hypothetical protein
MRFAFFAIKTIEASTANDNAMIGHRIYNLTRFK